MEDKKRLNILCLGVYDSMDSVLAPCAKDLESRGHNVTIVVYDKHDEINTKNYKRLGLDVQDVEDFKTKELDDIDAVIAAPMKLHTYRRILNGIDLRCIPTFSFATLFMTISMKMRADIVFTVGTDKFDEFEKNYLSYRCIAVGNPQYDALVPFRKTGNEDIKKVLIVDQGLYPYGENGKTQLAETLVSIANNNPDIEFRIKPRYLKNERGVKAHRGSEYLSDYIRDWPANLSEYEIPTNLEEVAPEYDAMITTWSTAFMDALVLNMPLILISGLDSIDVYDVRTQRVAEAYENLEHTGCVHDFHELLDCDIIEKFRTADPTYVKKAIYQTHETCADKISSVIEWYCENISGKGLMLDKVLQLTYDEFKADPNVFGTIPVDREKQGFKYIADRRRNLFMQECVYASRWLGGVLDLSPIRDEEIDLGQFHNWDELTPEVERWKTQFGEIQSKYFRQPETLRQLEEDIVLQDYYFEWLYNTGQYEKLEGYNGKMLAECSWNYYMACIYEKKNKRKGFKYLVRYLDEVENVNIVQVERQRRVQRMTRPFISEGINKYRWYVYIYKNNKGKLLDTFGQKGIRGVEFYDLVRIRTANFDGDYEKAIDLYKLYDEKYQKKKKKQGVKGILREQKNRVMHNRIEKEYRKALDKIAKNEAEAADK